MYSGTPLDIILLHTLLAYNSLLACYKDYSSDLRECLSRQAEGMMKPMKTLVLIQHHVKRILQKNNLVIRYCQPLLLAKNYTEIKA